MLIKAQPIIDTVEFVIKDNQMKKSDFSNGRFRENSGFSLSFFSDRGEKS